MNEDKLRRGFALLGRANGDGDLLGAALLAIHSALEDYLRTTLLRHSAVSSADQAVLEKRGSWRLLLDLAQRHLRLTPEQTRTILQAHRVYSDFAHGQRFAENFTFVQHYGQMVERLYGRAGLLEQMLEEQRRSREATEAEAVASEAEHGPSETPWRVRPRPAPTHTWRRAAVGAIVLIALVAALYVAVRNVDAESFLTSLGPQPPAVPVPTLDVPQPTPVRRARLIGIGEDSGWLHEEPNFESATLPQPLRDGMRVTLLDDQPVTAGETTWQRVSISGYEGWCPASNLLADQ